MSAEQTTAVGPFTCMYCTRGTDNDCDICDECLRENIRMEPTTITSGMTTTLIFQESSTAAVPLK